MFDHMSCEYHLCHFLKPVDLNPPRVTLTCGIFKMCLDKKEDTLWVGPEKPGVPVEIASLTELFGFGSGDFALSAESWILHCAQVFSSSFETTFFCAMKIIKPYQANMWRFPKREVPPTHPFK